MSVGMGLSDLTNFMRVLPSNRIVPDQVIWHDTYDIFKSVVKKDEFEGLYLQHLIQTNREFTGRGHGREVNLPYGGKSGYIKAFTPLRRMVATAMVDQETMDRAKSPGAQGNYVQREISQMMQDFNVLCELAAIGYPDGALARISTTGVQCDAAGTPDGSGSYVKITCDNTYADFGLWENVQLIRPGMRVELWSGATNLTATTETAANGANTANVGHVVVKKVVPGYRLASASWAATTGYIIVKACSATQAAALAVGGGSAIADNDIIYLYGTKANSLLLPAGLSALLQNNANGTYVDALDSGRVTELWVADASYGISSFNRADYDVLNTPTYDAADFGAASDSPSAGTPCYWTLSNLRDWINEREMATGVPITHLGMAMEMTECIDRMNVRENNISVTVSTVAGTSQTASGGSQAKKFRKSNGEECEIVPIRGFSKHTIVGIATESFEWGVQGGGFDYFRLYGTEWQPVMAQRWDSFEAPYGGYSQLGADRVDTCFVANDLRYDI